MRTAALLFSMLWLLTSCGGGDLDQWMAAQQKAITAIPRHTVSYSVPSESSYKLGIPAAIHPFNPAKMRLSAFSGDHGTKGILENFDLEQMQYVGYLKKGARIQAYVRVDDHVYTVYQNTPIGKRYGKVLAITPKKISILEKIENTDGSWTDSETQLDRSATDSSDKTSTENSIN
ncbi:MAG: pilus assembly protein PilP [Neisseriaceae bacterium]